MSTSRTKEKDDDDDDDDVVIVVVVKTSVWNAWRRGRTALRCTSTLVSAVPASSTKKRNIDVL